MIDAGLFSSRNISREWKDRSLLSNGSKWTLEMNEQKNNKPWNSNFAVKLGLLVGIAWFIRRFFPPAPRARDVAYANLSASQKLDLYTPPGKGPYPVIVHVHGGAWRTGDKADPRALLGITALIKNGYAVASVNYRLSAEAKFPAQIQDVKTAVRWLRAHTLEYKLDPERIGAVGESAGGHLVALLGTANEIPELEGLDLGNRGYSSRVQAVVDLFGPIDFLPDGGSVGDEINKYETTLLGKPLYKRPDLVKKANPITYISSDDPPFLIMHGTRDKLVPPDQSREFYDALLPVLGGEKVTSHFFQAGHSGIAVLQPSNMARIIHFLDQHLKR